MRPKAALTVWSPNAPALFSIAVNSAKRITAPRRTGGQPDALVSVVFAAASLETFLNESGLTVEGKPFVLSPASIIKRLASKNILAKLSPGLKGHIGMAGDTALADLILLDEIGSIPLTSPASDVMARWSFVIGTRAVAEWACRSAAQMATDLIEKAPVSLWKQFMEGQYLKAFSAPL